MATTKGTLCKRGKVASMKTSQTVHSVQSPDARCPICLDRLDNPAYLDRCLHRFCFLCIQEWSKNKAVCPLCKQWFGSIFHSVKADDDFKELVVGPTENGSFDSSGGQRFRYRTTVTGDWHQRRRTSPPPDNGVMFEGSVGVTGVERYLQSDQVICRMLPRLVSLRRAQKEGKPACQLHEKEMLLFRRALYRAGVRVVGVKDGGRHRDVSAEFFRSNPACMHRLSPWLKRELTALYGAHGSMVSILQRFIMSHITQRDVEDPATQHELRPFLLSHTDHFLHEFVSFAKAPFNMEAYDLHAFYDSATSSEEDDGSDSSLTDMSRNRGALRLVQWDDETPGPSFMMTEQPEVLSSDSESGSEITKELGESVDVCQSTSVHNVSAAVGEGTTSGEEDCIIVGYVKPWAERTPELVQLSSDSEESISSRAAEVAEQPQHLLYLSPSSPSDSTVSGQPASSPQDSPVALGHQTHRTGESPNSVNTSDEDYGREHQTQSSSTTRQRSGSRERCVWQTWECSKSTDWSHSQVRSRDRLSSKARTRTSWEIDYHHFQWSRDMSPKECRRASYSYYRWESRNMRRDLFQHNRSRHSQMFLSRSHSRSHSNSRESYREQKRHSWSPSSISSRSRHRRSWCEKPRGKRKYKARHLEKDSDRESSSRTCSRRTERWDESVTEGRSRDELISVDTACDSWGHNGSCSTHRSSRRRRKKKRKLHKKEKRHEKAKLQSAVVVVNGNSSQ